jgi:hypothetical protein
MLDKFGYYLTKRGKPFKEKEIQHVPIFEPNLQILGLGEWSGGREQRGLGVERRNCESR